MTSDDLLTRASGRARFCRDKGGVKTPDLLDELAARIRELEAERDEAVTQMIEAKVANKGVADGTHVIVPVEPTEAMLEASWDAKDDGTNVYIYRAMLRAAQPDATD